MRDLVLRSVGGVLGSVMVLAGCSKLGLSGQSPQSHELPTPQQLKHIHYMSQAPGPDGRPAFDHLEQAKSCHDLEIAMRWNRPPDIKGGPFNDKMIYVSPGIPTGLSKDSEVFLTGVVKRGESLPTGAAVWALKLEDGSELQAGEAAGYVEKQEEAQQAGGKATIIRPYAPGRVFCGYGVYQGDIGMALDGKGHVPLVSILFEMDRAK